MGIVQKEWVPAGQTVNQYYYKDILERLINGVIGFIETLTQTGSFSTTMRQLIERSL